MIEPHPRFAKRAALSRVHNAARDMADAYVAFEEASERLNRAAGGLGGATSDVERQLREACDTPERKEALLVIRSRLGVGR